MQDSAVGKKRPVMQDNLENKILNWLTTQGYPLEMKVATALRSHGFYVNQSPYYNDPDTGTSREIDIIATKGDDIGFLEIALIIECKTSTEKPWVLFTAENHEEGRNKFFTFGILSDLAREKLVECYWPKKESMEHIILNWMNKPSRTAFGITGAFSSGEDSTYKAVLGALKASIDYIKVKEDDYAPPLRFVFPIVVLAGRLFESYLDAEGNIIVEEVEEGFITNHRFIDGSYCSSVHVVTEKSLHEFCLEAEELASQLTKMLDDELKNMLKNMLAKNV